MFLTDKELHCEARTVLTLRYVFNDDLPMTAIPTALFSPQGCHQIAHVFNPWVPGLEEI